MYYLDKDVLEREVLACFIPLRGSPEAVNYEVRQQYRLLLKPLEPIDGEEPSTGRARCTSPCLPHLNDYHYRELSGSKLIRNRPVNKRLFFQNSTG